MNINAFINWCIEKSISFSLEGKDQLKVNAAPGALTPDIISQLKERKLEIINWLQNQMAKRILPRPASDKTLRLSYAQQRLWLLDQIDGGGPHYNMPGALKLTGFLNEDALNKAFNSILERHESLRTCFAVAEDGQPYQIIQTSITINVPLIDLSALEEADRQSRLSKIVEEDANLAFDLRNDLMLRAQLVKLADEEHALLVNMHHIASDGWSMSILINEFSALYSAYVQGQSNPLAPLTIQYADYAYWQRNWLKGEVLEQQVNYWAKQLAGLPIVHNLPSDFPRPPIKTFAGKTYVSHIDKAIVQKLKTLCQQEDGTLFMGLHAAFSAFLSRYSNETDIVIGSPIANREQAEIAGLIGFFVNTLVLRSDLSSHPSFIELLRQSKSTMVNAYAYQQVPFEQIVERLQPERSLSYSSLFQIMLVLQNNEQGELVLPGLTLNSVAQSNNIAKYDIRLDITDTQDGLLLQWEYSTDLFEAATIERMAKHFEILLNALVDSPDKNVFSADFLLPTERQQLLIEWNNTAADYPREKCIHELFEAQVNANPDAVAVAFESEVSGYQELTYAQLNQKANQLAHYLINEKQVKPDTFVGICIERSLEMVIGIVAILKAGGAYVPLDPEYPEARLKYMLDDANLSTVLTQRHLLARTPVSDAQALCLDSDLFIQELQTYPATNPDLTQQSLTSNNLAYVIYTSGSTGNPKGVMVEHHALVNRIDWMDREYGSSPSDRILQKTPFSFDVSVWEFVWPLSVGARIVLAKPEGHKDPGYLSALIRDQKITKLHFVPSMLGSMLALGDLSQCDSLQQVFCSGEALALHHVEEFKSVCPWAKLHNLYGPTEAAIDVSYWDCSQSHVGLNSVPIGRPINNIQLHILNPNLVPVPQNVAGELHIGGVGLARGYLNRADLTTEKFIPNPFYDNNNPASSQRLYKTGDLVRWLPNGNVEFLGRIDHQVKIRGFRIELGEIENALTTHEDVNEAVVLAKASERGDTQLLAYIVPNENLQKVEHVVDVNATTFMFDDMYKNSLLENNEDPYSNFVGWNSSYTAQPIPLDEMEAWRTATVNRILELNPKRVLEIGVGSGLLFWKIVPQCESYWGTDLSNSTLQKLQAVLNHHPDLAEKVKLRQQEALDFSGLPSGFFDTVIINSVVQYFPDVNYLTQVLHSAINIIAPNGNIFIGDVRNLRLLPMFQTAVQVSRAQDDLSLNHVKKLINTSVRREEELLLDPEFFDGFIKTTTRVSGLDLQVKTHAGNNELTQYRYDVVLRVEALAALSAKEFKSLLWGHDLESLAELRQFLSGAYSNVSGSQSKGLRIRNVPNERLAAHSRACQQFEKATNLAELKTLLNTLKQSAFDIEAFASCALETGHVLRVTWARKGHADLLDIIFIRAVHLSGETALVDVYDSEWNEDSSLYHYANNPRLGTLHIKLINSLRDYVQQHLPDYMEPNNFVIMDTLPLTPNGKVDRKTLMASDVEYLQTTYVAPRTEIEKILCSIWQEVLGVERVGVMDNFFHLGGHSLSATRVVARINQTLNVSLVLKELFNTQTLEGLAQTISRLDANLARPALIAISRDDVLLPSFAQQRLWLLDQIEQGSAHYNMPSALKLTGKLDYQALTRAFDSILERHESLRTCFVMDANSQPIQFIQSAPDFQVQITDLSALEEGKRQLQLAALMVEESSREFNLRADVMLRAQLVKVGSDEHILLVTMHHIASDGWSISILVNEFSALYTAYTQGQQNPLPPLPIQYADYAHWQRNWLQGEVLNQQLGYWTKQLASLPIVHSLPLDHTRPATQRFSGVTYNSQIPSTISEGLSSLCKAQGATLFMGLHAAFSVLLSRYSNETDIVVGSPIANREQAEVANLIGFFVNTLVLRSDLSGNPSFTSLLNQSKEMLLDAYAHQQVPFEQIVERLQPERSLSHSPLFQIMLVLQNNESGILELPGLLLSPVEQSGAGVAKYDLTLNVLESQQGLILGWEFNTDLFEQQTIARMANHFELLLKALIETPEQNVFNAGMLDVQERQQLLVDWNNTQTPYPNEKCIHELFEAQVKSNPNGIAVIFKSQQLTYQQLNGHANQLAHYLITEKHITPDTLVGICVERSLDMIVSMLAILKAGGAYVPLDPDYPEARLAYMLEDAKLGTVLTQSHLRETTPINDQQAICLDSENIRQQLAQQPLSNPDLQAQGLTSAHLAYVIYTSGSTGNPKGSLLNHSGLCNLALGQIAGFSVKPDSRVLQFASVAFDAATSELFMALVQGATAILLSDEERMSPEILSDKVEQHQITHATLPPVLLSHLDIQKWDSVQTLIVAGDKCSDQLASTWSNGRTFINAYGPSEATVCSSLGIYQKGDTKLHIGKPLQNVQLYVLNEMRQLAPLGAVGELYVGGVGLARGYLNRPDLTAEKFVANPFYDKNNSSISERLYKTGDLVRWLPDGNLEFLGRIDYQIKIRGFRVELGEIENTLSTHDDVKDVVVLAKESSAGEKYLAAYVVTDAIDSQDESENATVARNNFIEHLHSHINQTLPDYMVPSAFVILNQFPLTPNGKVDRKALPEPDLSQQQTAYVAPRTETEKRLCEIWQEILGVEHVGITDNFFRLGGDSLKVVRFASAAIKVGLSYSVADVMKQPTIERLAELSKSVDELQAQQETIVGEVPLSCAQQFFLNTTLDKPNWGNTTRYIDLPGLDKTIFEQTLLRVLTHHDALRSTFIKSPQGWKQFIVSPEELNLSAAINHIDCSNMVEEERVEWIDRFMVSKQGEMDLLDAPLIRVHIFYLGEQKGYVGRLNIHHLLLDGYSSDIFFEDWMDCYLAVSSGKEFNFPRKTASTSQWIHRHIEQVNSSVTHDEINYWLNLPWDKAVKIPMDYDVPHENTAGSNTDIPLVLSKHHTDGLLKVSATSEMPFINILISVLAKMMTSYSNGQWIPVRVLDSGRGFDLGLDVSRTLGWLSVQRTLMLEVHDDLPLLETIKLVNTQIENIPNKGFGFELIQCYHKDEFLKQQLELCPKTELFLNFHGFIEGNKIEQQDDAEVVQPFSAKLDKGIYRCPWISPGNINNEKFTCNAIVIDGQLHLTWRYSQNLYTKQTINLLTNQLMKTLIALSESSYLEAGIDQVKTVESEMM